MSDRAIWKMLHLLYTLPPGRKGLTDRELIAVGVDCYSDTVELLLVGGAAQRLGNEYSLTPASREILRACVVANRRWPSDDLLVDNPTAFVVMPFRESWSDTVYNKLILPAVRSAKFECVRGDKVVRIGDLTKNVWGAIMKAGIIIAEVSVPNANVFYELGLAHALGKDAILLKQQTAKLPADFGGAHYHEYDPESLGDARKWLKTELTDWAKINRSAAVKALRVSKRRRGR